MLSDMGMMINRRRVCGGEKLPYDAEIEYLEVPSSSNSYLIDLGFYVHRDDTLIVNFWMEDLNDNNNAIHIFRGSNDVYNGTHNFRIMRYNASGQNYAKVRVADHWDAHSAYRKMFTLGVRHTISISLPLNKILCDENAMINTDGNNTLSSALYDSNGYMNETLKTLFNSNTPILHTKFYSLKISGRNNVDIIPVRVGTTGYLYDKVSGQLFGNQGTGSFILGPDV